MIVSQKSPTVYTPAEEMRQVRRRDFFITLEVGALLLLCLLAIALGIYVSLRSSNEGIPILAALGCAALINVLLGPKGE